jgi:aconitate hydratase
MLHILCSSCVTGALNSANDKVNMVVNVLTGEEDSVPGTARYYKQKGLPWIVVGE